MQLDYWVMCTEFAMERGFSPWSIVQSFKRRFSSMPDAEIVDATIAGFHANARWKARIEQRAKASHD